MTAPGDLDAGAIGAARQRTRFLDAQENFLDLKAAQDLAGKVPRQRFEHPPHKPENDAEPTADDVDLEDVQVWDLISAFHELMAEVGREPVTHDVI